MVVVVVVVVAGVVVLTLTRIIKSVVTGQTPVTLELRNTPGKKHEPTVPAREAYGLPRAAVFCNNILVQISMILLLL